MIPKIIHHCWFGLNKKSDLAIQCIESWKKYLPDFEIREWNESSFPIDDYPFAKEAYAQGKYAFVADVARLYALQKEGGVYLDTDMEVLKPIHHLLEDTAFVGFESKELIATSIIGSVSNGEFINLLLEHYKARPFSTTSQPYVVTTILSRIGFDIDGESQQGEGFLTIYSEDYFYPYSYYTQETHFTENTLCLHHYEGSWVEEKERKQYNQKPTDRIVVVQLMGGLGNQMYQYASDKALAERNNARLIVDTRTYDQVYENVTPRQYELSAFELKVDFLCEQTLQQLSNVNVYQEKLWHKYDENINTVPLPCYLTGYWQSEKYFKSIEELLRMDFRIKESHISPKVKELGAKLSETSSSVSIHIRRTDYAVHPNYFLPLHYYQCAVKYMQNRVPTPSFFVFSDDPDWAEQHFDIPTPFQVIRGHSGIEDMYLMSQCRHNITANSSFSWWAAWLNRYRDKIVIAPQKYLYDASLDVKDMDLMPKEWVCLW